MKIKRRRLVLLLCSIALFAIAWWLFGINIHRQGEFTWIQRRTFGRTTRIHYFSRDWIELQRYLYPWSEPFVLGDPLTTCAAIQPEVWEDRNLDGRWDTWHFRVGPDHDGECQVEYRIDTNGDGDADWKFVSDDYEEAEDRVRARRGF